MTQEKHVVSLSLKQAFEQIELALAAGGFERAEAICRQVLAVLPHHATATGLLVRILTAAGQDAAAEQARQRLLALQQLQYAQDQKNQAFSALEQAKLALQAALPHLGDLPPAASLRWQVGQMLGETPWFFSQAGQDAWLYQHLFTQRRNGVFVDVGAHDGVTGSNTLFFEMALGWSGLCIEPVPDIFARLQMMRRVPCLQVGIADQDGEAEFVSFEPDLSQMGGLRQTYDPDMRARVIGQHKQTEKITRIKTRRLGPLLAEQGVHAVDLLCIDVEGAEAMIIADFDFSALPVQVLVVENNQQNTDLRRLVAQKGFVQRARLGMDDVFVWA